MEQRPKTNQTLAAKTHIVVGYPAVYPKRAVLTLARAIHDCTRVAKVLLNDLKTDCFHQSGKNWAEIRRKSGKHFFRSGIL